MSKGQRMVHLQVDISIREATRILKRRYKTNKMSDALRKFMTDHDEALMKTADAMADMLGESDDFDEDDEDEPQPKRRNKS